MIARAGVAGLLAATALAAPMPAGAQPKLMGWDDLMSRPLPHATARVAYGPDPLQIAEVWRPDGKGPFPTVLMIHGGCWRSGTANLHIMDYAAEDLRKRGIGVWNIEYRGVDRPGGGYPGTFQDVNAAADALMAHGREYRLDTSKLIVLGHSAGGHLAAWLAGRAGVPATSPVRDVRPLKFKLVVILGGLPDLETANAGCGASAVAKLLAGSPRADPLDDTSPPRLLPLRAPQLLINGALDDTAPPDVARAYTEKVGRPKGGATYLVVPGEGHVEEIAPGSAAWTDAASNVEAVLR